MAKQLYTNNASSLLQAAITSGAVTMTVTTGQGGLFPNPSAGSWFMLTLYDGSSTIEIVKCTARTGDNFTIVRAQESTSASAFALGASVLHNVTEGTLEQFLQRSGDGLAITAAKTLTVTNSITLSGTDSTTMTFPSTSATIAGRDVNNTFSKAQRGAYVALTSTSNSIAVDLSLSNNYSHTLTENTTLAAPSNIVAGQSGVIEIKQHASSAKTLAYNSFWKKGSGVDLTISVSLSSVNVLCYVVDSTGTFATCTLQVAVS